ncbi:enoyl-CoA hydratase-related protein [Streptomyces sp. Y7]|uniref:enoyl-CoA hydratase-related protein n=1 Tax=Streptomyces sp. Y7 TaxID=3342392 RepID=UPI0037229413
MTETGPTVSYVVEEGVATVTLNRPDRLNALDPATMALLHESIRRADRDPDARCVVLIGAGEAFCVGADVSMVESSSLEPGKETFGDPAAGARNVMECRKPTIAAVNGWAAGVGMAIACLCDIRIVSANARFTTSFVRRGLIGEYGIAWTLPRIVGYGIASDLLMSGRRIGSTEAAGYGLASMVVPADEFAARVREYAVELAAYCSPTSAAVLKEQLRLYARTTFEEAVADTTRLMAESLARADVSEGVSSYVERRPPAFEPLIESALRSAHDKVG